MKIKYLGTAAAEAIPGTFCECEVCQRSRELGGKNIRKRSQAIVDDKILIDFPADTYINSILHNIHLSKIKTCLITHNHGDHLYTAELWCRNPGIANNIDNEAPLTMYAAAGGYRRIVDAVLEYGQDESKRVIPKKITPFVPFEAEGYEITPLRANHDPNSDPVIYIISKDGKNMLYAHDTGFFPEETVEYMKKSGVKLDFVSFDCCGTVLPDEDYGKWGHLNFIGDVKMRELLRENGNITDSTICAVNHFSHNGAPLHDELVLEAKKYAFDYVSYDGLEIEF